MAQPEIELLSAVGRVIYQGYRLPIALDGNGDPNTHRGIGGRFRLLYIPHGAGVVLVGSRRVPFSAPCIFCEDEESRISLVSGTHITARCLYFDPVTINASFTIGTLKTDYEGFKGMECQDLKWLDAFLGRSERLLHMGPGAAKRLSDLMDTLESELSEQRDWNWPCRSRSYFLEILLLADRLRYEPKGAAGRASEHLGSLDDGEAQILDILSYLHARYPEKITLEDLARQFHTNRTTLSRKFTQLTGHSINSYLVNLRVQLAASMLRDTTLPVQEVMYRTGFTDSSHFNRTFKKVTGAGPSEYRSLYCWMA